jgi:hypothetical protein
MTICAYTVRVRTRGCVRVSNWHVGECMLVYIYTCTHQEIKFTLQQTFLYTLGGGALRQDTLNGNMLNDQTEIKAAKYTYFYTRVVRYIRKLFSDSDQTI